MTTRILRSPSATLRRSAKLGGYLAAGIGASVLGTAESEAAIVTLDLGPSGFNLLGPNGNIPSGQSRTVANFPVTGLSMVVKNNAAGVFGISPTFGVGGGGTLKFAYNYNQGGPYYAVPRRFAANALINDNALFSPDGYKTYFRFGTSDTSNWGASSYLGFNAAGRYGYIEATWDSSANSFALLSAAYESTDNTPILAGAVPVPEPSAIALTGLGALALGTGAIRRNRRARKDSLAATA